MLILIVKVEIVSTLHGFTPYLTPYLTPYYKCFGIDCKNCRFELVYCTVLYSVMVLRREPRGT